MIPGSKFWKSSRKVMVAKSSETHFLRQRRSRAKRSKTDVLEQIREFVESRDATQQLGNSSSTEDVETKIKDIFKCTICLNTPELPGAVCTDCYHIIGCIPCIEQWHQTVASSSAKCPLCRTKASYQIVPIIRGIADVLGQSLSARSTKNTDEDGEDSDDADLLTSVFD
ncbi:hypothetical protein AC249_AIPGENE10224 [Exaiptasia diaphana]|nr:hypothetical protein AC249_AIPGENE10224 [Exaiptasia diaphana]